MFVTTQQLRVMTTDVVTAGTAVAVDGGGKSGAKTSDEQSPMTCETWSH